MTPSPGILRLSLPGSEVTITFEPAVASARILSGKTPAEVIRLVGIIHNLCGEAHRAAATAATGLPVSPEVARAVMLEILREHLVILCRSAPPLLGLPAVALPLAFSRLGAAFVPGGDPMRESLSRALFGSSSGTIFPHALASLPHGVASDSLLAPFFARLAAREQEMGLVASPDAAAGDPTFFARVAPALAAHLPEDCGPLRARLLGRLHEVGTIMNAFGTAAEGDYLPELIAPGVARIAAARGMLVHRATLAGEIVAAYAIETPTTAMLAPQGPLARFLGAIAQGAGADAAMLRLGLLAFDPCVPHALTTQRTNEQEMAHA